MDFSKQADYNSQEKMMANGSPEDHCGRCNCLRRDHRNKKTYSYAKTQGSSGAAEKFQLPPLLVASAHIVFAFVLASLSQIRKLKNILMNLEVHIVMEQQYLIPQMLLERHLAASRLLVKQMTDRQGGKELVDQNPLIREFVLSTSELEKWFHQNRFDEECL